MAPQAQHVSDPPSAAVADDDRTATKPVRRRRPPSAVAGAVYPITFLALLAVAWFVVTATELVQPYIIPSPGDTWSTFTDHGAYLWEHTLVTTGETVAGFVIAAVVGILVAVLMVYSPALEKTFYPLILFAQVVPKIAIAPLFVVWLGFGTSPKILVAVLMAFFPVVISGISGLRSVDPELLELTSTMGASRVKTFWKVRFPAALPELLSGLKVAATLAVTGAVVGEFVGANSGLGYVILQANGNIDTPMLFAALIIMSALGVLLFALIQLAEMLLIPWHASRRNRV
ncbi:ABC transporter permease [Streptomyces sp. XM4193]|uniref:ABC transporter permease n=1 Tax=Streptomyces sp. XM4193 TaxID=2929782 RepID=UPI001FF9FB18|nr:ABC transporter permease [Streptomyces sp. XM4193]MCK1797608.1 ABC transporter permease [Streptomyces sp. XM4193]